MVDWLKKDTLFSIYLQILKRIGKIFTYQTNNNNNNYFKLNLIIDIQIQWQIKTILIKR